ncbi:DUF3306 domain-containing protein [Azospirillum sp. TSO35-2]|uniref:DUF3306 domain-containing protein n=1 Tax=Azospirillum sp. TSO35-2 TaxID=716796 RepID=UPI000D64A541|nr:DUF3306 domain-containing protein [Azospirillum sp. TSO35-2]
MSDEAFLSRWSRLKRTATKPEPTPLDGPPPVDEVAPLPAVVAGESAADSAPASDSEASDSADPLKDLPPIEELTGESDFTPFLRAGVPEDVHRQALRKLWTSDPIYANDDGLKDYADDYTGLFTGSAPVKTLYRAGKGFLDALDEVVEGADPAPAVPASCAHDVRADGVGRIDDSPTAPDEGEAPPAKSAS